MMNQNNPQGSQNRPASPEQAPDPTRNYERSHPELEAGMGRLDNNVATPADAPDRQEEAVTNRQASRQINASEDINKRAEGGDVHGRHPEARQVVRESGHPAHPAGAPGSPLPEQPDHSMKEEEPMGWDQAPTDIHDPRRQRHPRTEGKGGTP